MPSAVMLINPKYPRNVGAVLRACACYGVDDLRYTGTRLDRELKNWGRLPREERMKGYKTTTWKKTELLFEEFPGLVPIAVEVRPNSQMLQHFEHPENALYVFGPEDGGLTGVTLRHCHHFVAIPTAHCLNLAVSVATVLYDRHVKLNPDARLTVETTESRGWRAFSEDDNYEEVG